MRKELQKAKALVEKGQIKEALDLLKSMSAQFKGAISKCPGCGEKAPMLQKDSTLHGECSKCGAVWGGKSTNDLVKVGDNMKDETRKLTKKQVIAELWELYRSGDSDADAFSINNFEATGWLKKTLAIKLGLPLPEEKLEKSALEEVKKAVPTISDAIRGKRFPKYFAKADKQEMINEHERLLDVLRSPSHKDDKKEAEIQAKELKELKDSVRKNDMSRDDVIDVMLGMFKAGEETALVNRHSIAKYETTGEINEDVLKVVFRKAKRDYNELCKAIEEEEIKKFDDEDEGKHHKHMQRMIDDGSVWHFEGAMGRHAMDLMRAGHVTLGPKSHKDFYGNHVPAHHEVKPGTLGSKEYQKRKQEENMDKAIKLPPPKGKVAQGHAGPPAPKDVLQDNKHPAAPKSLVGDKVGQTPPSMVAPAAQTDSKGGVSVHVHVDRGGPDATSQASKPANPSEHKPERNSKYSSPPRKNPLDPPTKPPASPPPMHKPERNSLHQAPKQKTPPRFEKADSFLFGGANSPLGSNQLEQQVDRGGNAIAAPAPAATPTPAPVAKSKIMCKGCKKSSVLAKDALCKECGPKVKKTDKNSPRGRAVLPEGELKEGMKDAGEYTGPAKPIVKK